MSNESVSARTGTEPDRLATVRGILPASHRVILGASVASLGAVAGGRLLSVLHNVPFDPLAVPAGVLSTATGVASLVLALSLVGVGLSVPGDRAPARVGLLFAGVFGPMTSLSGAASLPAATGLTLGVAVALLGTVSIPVTSRNVYRATVAAGFVAALAVSLGSSVGLLGGGLHGLGGVLALGSVTATVVYAETDRTAFLVGGVATAAVVLASATSPFVVGSALLVGFATVGVPHVLVALAAGAGVAVAVAGFRRGDHALAAGAGLLVLAGVPVALPRAMALALGATLVLLDAETLAGREVRT